MHIVIYVVFPMSFTRLNISHLYIEMAYNSFQGFILALLFCFLNEEVHAEIRRLWMRKRNLRRDSMALTRSFALSSVRKPSFQTRPSSTGPAEEQESSGTGPYPAATDPTPTTTDIAATTTTQNNHHHHHANNHSGLHQHNNPSSSSGDGAATALTPAPTFRLTRACSDSSGGGGSDFGSADDSWLRRLKERARGVFARKKSSESRQGVIDTRYDCDGVPDIDVVDLFVYNRPSVGSTSADSEGGDGGGGGGGLPNHRQDCTESSDCLTYPKG